MSAEEIAKLLNTGNTEDSTLQTLLGDYFYSPTQSDGYSDCESDDDDDECDGLLLATPEQLHFTSQQQLSQHLEEQEEEYDDEEPLITPATSNTIVVEAEDLELDEREFEKDDLMRVRWDLQELTKDQLEMTILGHLMSTTSCETVERNRTEYEYRGKKICKKLFLFIYSIRNGTYKNLRRHFLQNGMKLRNGESLSLDNLLL